MYVCNVTKLERRRRPRLLQGRFTQSNRALISRAQYRVAFTLIVGWLWLGWFCRPDVLFASETRVPEPWKLQNILRLLLS